LLEPLPVLIHHGHKSAQILLI